MLQLPNFGHIATSIIKVESLDHILLVMSWSKIMMSSPLLRNTLIWRRPGVVIFADIIKLVTMFIKTITNDSRKAKRIRNYVSKSNLYVYFLM